MTVEAVGEKVFLPGLEREIMFLSPYMAWPILVAYLSFTKFVGPTMMKNRKPFNLQGIMILYNAVLVASNVYLSVIMAQKLFLLWPYRCDFTSSPVIEESKQSIISLCTVCFYVKFAELFDTVFFILRKKYNQVTFLHIFHHFIVFLMVFICLRNSFIKFHMLIIGTINSSVHVALYSYYGLSALGPGVRKHLWWKKYLTTLQIVQFFVLMFYMVFSMMTGCERYSVFDRSIFICIVIITALFCNFYYQEYKKRK